MNYFRHMILSNAIIHAVWMALALGLFFTSLGRRSRPANVLFGVLIIICAILAIVLDFQAYQSSY